MKLLASLTVIAFLIAVAMDTQPLFAQQHTDVQAVTARLSDSGDAGYYEAASGGSRGIALACDGGACDGLVSNCNGRLPLWTATADALFLNRSDPSSSVLAFNTANPAENLNAADFNFGVHTGFDLSLIRRIGGKNAIELRYFGIDHWNSQLSVPTTPGDLFQVNAAVPVFTFSGNAMDASYASALHSSELNFRHRVNDVLSVLVGFRYAELNEHLSANLVGSAIPFNYETETRNRLYGAQLGGQVEIWNQNRLSVNAVGKAGIYGNAAGQDSFFSTGVVTLPTNGRDSRTAFIGEVGLNGALKLSEHFALRSGYRLLWLDGVALADKQLSESDFANGTGFNSSGDVFYHGAFTGLEFSY